jgi:adenosylhomocysteinase
LRERSNLSKIAESKLAEQGKRNFEWARKHMDALVKLADKHAKERTLDGLKVGVCLHITKETSVLIDSLLRAGAELYVAAANPLSTSDDVAAYIATRAEIWAWRGETDEEYTWCIRQVLSKRPDQIIDDGADMHVMAHEIKANWIRGGTEETTTGVVRLRALEKERRILYPVIAVNNARTKFLFDNRYGTGQSTIDGLLRATSLLLAGKNLVVVGYGWVGRGIAMRGRGMGAKVNVVESDPIKALEAHLDGFPVGKVSDFVRIGDIYVTATGQKDVIRYEHIERMKDGAILANAGHFDVEIDVKTLASKAKYVREVRQYVEEFVLPNGRSVYVVAKGRVVNLVAAEGHPPEVMQMSFANQLESTVYISKNFAKMERKLYDVPAEVENEVAKAALKSYGIRIENLTREQKRYAESWRI